MADPRLPTLSTWGCEKDARILFFTALKDYLKRAWVERALLRTLLAGRR
jgi:hypothetical protein